jgi:two-component system, OmpR family, response regulator
MPKPHILLVDDEPSIREPLAKYLDKQGFRVTDVENAALARSVLLSYSIDLVLLDIMMPGEDGLSLCRHLAANGGPPVILLTAKDEETDKVVGLEIGADDYVSKPFSPRELVARIRTVLRRTGNNSAVLGSGQRNYGFAGWTLKTAEQSLYDPEGVLVPLSSGEFKLLEVLVLRAGQVLDRDQLLDLTKGREGGPFDRAIDNAISRLRRKIEPEPKSPKIIKTIWGGGYRFTALVSKL